MITKAALLTTAAVALGFFVGFGIGAKTRENTASHVKTNMSGGVLTVQVDAGGAIEGGAKSYLEGLF